MNMQQVDTPGKTNKDSKPSKPPVVNKDISPPEPDLGQFYEDSKCVAPHVVSEQQLYRGKEYSDGGSKACKKEDRSHINFNVIKSPHSGDDKDAVNKPSLGEQCKSSEQLGSHCLMEEELVGSEIKISEIIADNSSQVINLQSNVSGENTPLGDGELNMKNVPDLLRNMRLSSNEKSKLPLSEFSTLRNFLKKMFLGTLDDSKDILVNFGEIMIFAAILQKKFDVELPVYNIYPLHLLKSEFYRSKKRPEECYKFVFKYAYKQLKQKYSRSHVERQILANQPDNFIDFYDYYFGEVSQARNIPISHFYLPLTPDSTCLKAEPLAPKTINLKYASLISMSPLFMSDFTEYLDNHFVAHYSQLIISKIDFIVDKWNEIFFSMNCGERSLFFIADHIKFNKKSKLPWTIIEVKKAIEVVKRMIERARTGCFT